MQRNIVVFHNVLKKKTTELNFNQINIKKKIDKDNFEKKKEEEDNLGKKQKKNM